DAVHGLALVEHRGEITGDALSVVGDVDEDLARLFRVVDDHDVECDALVRESVPGSEETAQLALVMGDEIPFACASGHRDLLAGLANVLFERLPAHVGAEAPVLAIEDAHYAA